MLKSRAKWQVNASIDETQVDRLAEQLNVSPLVAQLLITRGMEDERVASAFLETNRDLFHDPFLMLGMHEAVQRIEKALQQNETIRIYGDYDADGVSATALLLAVLSQLGARVDYYIPHRLREGYGLNAEAIDHAVQSEVSLMITVDNGISAHEEIAYATAQGLDVIVTDHHEPSELLPEAYAILNPKQRGCSYPFKELAGVGVALKLAHALLDELPEELLQLAALGTVADIMPLLDENRLIVKLGLKQIQQAPLVGLQALAMVAGVELNELDETHLGFNIGPRINAGGRIGEASKAVQLLVTDDVREAEHLASALNELNKQRQQIVADITAEAMDMYAHDDAAVIVLAQENWHVGVIGIVASKFTEKFYRPTIILNIDADSGLAKGSARSIPGFDLFKSLTECDALLSHYGGHQMAAGMTLPSEHIEAFREKMDELAKQWLDEEDFIPLIEADMTCSIADLSVQTIEQLQLMAPFGQGNASPQFVLNSLRINDMKLLGKEKQHLKLTVSQANANTSYTLDAIGFNMGDKARYISPHARLDLLGEMTINEWNGVRKPQLRIHDMRIVERQVFDWRGRANHQALSQLSDDCRPVLLLTSEAERSNVGEPFQALIDAQCPVWVMDEDGEAPPFFKMATDIVLASLPTNMTALQSALYQAERAERVYISFHHIDEAARTLPSREAFKQVYAELAAAQQWHDEDQRFLQSLQRKTNMSLDMIRFVFGVFEELSFIEMTGTAYRIASSPARRELHTSTRYRQREQRIAIEDILVYSTTQQLTQWIKKQLPERQKEE